MLPQLTRKQKETLQAIENFLSSNQIPPTLSELQGLLKVSSNQAVINHLEGLEEKGYIERKKVARGIRVLKGLQEEEDLDFIELLSDIQANRKNIQRKQEQKSTFSEPLSNDDNNGQIIFGAYNNEQY
ncbi:hypothetical protein A2773_02825 [Candidatus Gottesmanbacteria bacterium RIFCSPHIGHO2_01_FULL_39_10]|uniref:LexA repressor DNA-binding domain-containing protein n=1 Tax=Candidatus Gottesmanbacteria bacterium RIFCSPHIGHO2_01_FULL_39_10 TaxID=1798375 RepID=A0A1F5ZMA0_9BACT|nr:MAG: hypothetical protein A2773_02825 [Candidatus Gottesmanbacteria bacterium RIFCSPHIGHO2_01_FULL_39_10]